VRILRRADFGDDVIDHAIESGRLPTLAIEIALGEGAVHTLTDLAQITRLPSPDVRELMQALGRPDPRQGERVFTKEDLELVGIVAQIREAGLPEGELTEVARVIGLSMAQSADAVRRLVAEAFLEPGDSEATLGARYVDAVETLAPLIPDLFALSFRAHLRDGISGELLTEAERRAGRLSETEDVAVAFADLVGYTSLGDRVSAGDLGSLAGRFAAAGVAAARPPVRLVKTIGDAAMFVSADPDALLEVLLDLRARLIDAEPAFPAVRIGAAFGPATARGGDWFGMAVNLASRVAEAAKPGQLLATNEFAASTSQATWKKRRRRTFKGVDGRSRLCSYEADGTGRGGQLLEKAASSSSSRPRAGRRQG
jgi:adenylate cyclase